MIACKDCGSSLCPGVGGTKPCDNAPVVTWATPLRLSLIEIDQIYQRALCLTQEVRHNDRHNSFPDCISAYGDDFLDRVDKRIWQQFKAEMDRALKSEVDIALDDMARYFASRRDGYTAQRAVIDYCVLPSEHDGDRLDGLGKKWAPGLPPAELEFFCAASIEIANRRFSCCLPSHRLDEMHMSRGESGTCAIFWEGKKR